MLETIPAPTTITMTPFNSCSVARNQTAAGTQTIQVPTNGNSARKPIMTPQNTGGSKAEKREEQPSGEPLQGGDQQPGRDACVHRSRV